VEDRPQRRGLLSRADRASTSGRAAAARGYTVYILRCRDGTLYTGIAVDPERRLAAHGKGTASRYTRSRRPVRLVYVEPQPSRGAALRREAAIKRLTRAEKLRLIRRRRSSRAVNPPTAGGATKRRRSAAKQARATGPTTRSKKG
jgi:putative endonuclease